MRRLVLLVAAGTLAASGFAFAAGLPGIPGAFLPYKHWHRVNAKPIRPTPTTAHGADVKNVYASKPATGGRYPYGTIVVKEGLTRKFVSLIATMRKVKGADAKHGDWVFVEYARSSATSRFSKIADGAVCWSCHQLAKKTDWIFTRK